MAKESPQPPPLKYSCVSIYVSEEDDHLHLAPECRKESEGCRAIWSEFDSFYPYDEGLKLSLAETRVQKIGALFCLVKDVAFFPV